MTDRHDELEDLHRAAEVARRRVAWDDGAMTKEQLQWLWTTLEEDGWTVSTNAAFGSHFVAYPLNKSHRYLLDATPGGPIRLYISLDKSDEDGCGLLDEFHPDIEGIRVRCELERWFNAVEGVADR